MLIVLFLVVIISCSFLVILSTKKGRERIRNIYCHNGKINFIIVGLTITIFHFLVSFFLLGFLTVMGEGGTRGGLLSSLLVFLYKVIGFNPFFMALEFLDKSTPRVPIPNFMYFPTSFILNSLLWGSLITVIFKTIRDGEK